MGLACSIMKGPVGRDLPQSARALARRGDRFFHLSPSTFAWAGPEAAPAHHVIRSGGRSRPRRPASATAPWMTTGPDLPPPWTSTSSSSSTSGSVCVSTRRGGETLQKCPAVSSLYGTSRATRLLPTSSAPPASTATRNSTTTAAASSPPWKSASSPDSPSPALLSGFSNSPLAADRGPQAAAGIMGGEFITASRARSCGLENGPGFPTPPEIFTATASTLWSRTACRVDEFDQFVIAEGVMLEKMTRAGLSRTYKSSAGLIREIIGDPVPPDIEHLISKMKMTRTPAYLILVHPSLIPLVSRSQAYCNAHDILCANISKNDIAELLKCLQDSLKQWDHTVTSNKLLKHFFGQAVKNTKRLFSNLWDLECNSLKHLKTLGMYTRKQVSTLTLCKFAKVLPFLYWMLWNKKLLTKLEIGNYFCRPGSPCCRLGFCLRKNIRLSLESNKVNCKSKSELP
jgi:hypothetical protein